MLTAGSEFNKPFSGYIGFNPYKEKEKGNEKVAENPIDKLHKNLDWNKLLFKIFSDLNLRDFQSAGCVSTGWNKVYRNTGFNKKKEDSQNQIKHSAANVFDLPRKIEGNQLAANIFNLSLPRDMKDEIFSHLTFKELLKTLSVSKTWQAATTESLWKAFLSDIAFGAKHYLKYFGLDVGVEPPLSPEIIKLWLQGSPFWQGESR